MAGNTPASVGEAEEDELQTVMNVLIATGMDPKDIDPGEVYTALCRAQGNVDEALVGAFHIPYSLESRNKSTASFFLYFHTMLDRCRDSMRAMRP